MATFQTILDLVETLPESQQEDLVNLLRRRQQSHHRQLLGQRISEARNEFARGEVRVGTVEDAKKVIRKYSVVGWLDSQTQNR